MKQRGKKYFHLIKEKYRLFIILYCTLKWAALRRLDSQNKTKITNMIILDQNLTVGMQYTSLAKTDRKANGFIYSKLQL